MKKDKRKRIRIEVRSILSKIQQKSVAIPPEMKPILFKKVFATDAIIKKS